MSIASSLFEQMKEKKITIYRVSELTHIQYTLLWRVFHGKRKLTADELYLILLRTGIRFEEVTGLKQSDV